LKKWSTISDSAQIQARRRSSEAQKMLIEPAKEWHLYRLIDGPQGRGYKKL